MADHIHTVSVAGETGTYVEHMAWKDSNEPCISCFLRYSNHEDGFVKYAVQEEQISSERGWIHPADRYRCWHTITIPKDATPEHHTRPRHGWRVVKMERMENATNSA